MATGLLELALVVSLAALCGILARLLRQPLILAYLVSGVVLGLFGIPHLAGKEAFQMFAELGVMFVLFLVGLEINFGSLRLVGRQAILIGLGQVIFTFAAGYVLAFLIGFSRVASAYIAIALTLSSTVIAVKMLSDKRDLHSLYGRLSLGILLVQDFIAVLVLVFLTSIGQGGGSLTAIGFSFLRAAIACFLILWLGRSVLPKIFDQIARSPELLFVSSIAWLLALAALFSYLGLSAEIAGLLAGLALANSSEKYEIAAKVRPLRDFFLIVFFVLLGASLSLIGPSGGKLGWPVILLSLFVLIGNPLIVMVIMGYLGYRRRTSFLTGVTIAQISEFSMILGALGLRIGHLSELETALITAVGVVTITTSSYMVVHADHIFSKLVGPLGFFERRRPRDEFNAGVLNRKPIILIGCHRLGRGILVNLPLEKVLVVDFDPEVIAGLRRHGHEYLLGDIADPDLFERAHVAEANMVISTSPSVDYNLALIAELKRRGSKAVVILRASSEEEMDVLYRAGADYVILPHLSSGYHLGQILAGPAVSDNLIKLKTQDQNIRKKAVLKAPTA